MGKAARNRRNRQQRSRAADRLKRSGYTRFRADSAEGKQLLAKIAGETEMPCRATFLDDPMFGGRPAVVTDMTPDGGLITDRSDTARRMPVLLFEPMHVIGMPDPDTGLLGDPGIDVMVGAGWQRVPAAHVMAGLPADGWGLSRTATGVELRNPYGCIVAEGRLALDPHWVSAAVSTGSVMVFYGPYLGVRVPPGRSPQSYTDADRAAEFRQGCQSGLLVTATVTWHTGPPAETVTWVLLAEGALGQPSPPVAYVPRLNLKAHGGPQAFGFADLSAAGPGPAEIPVARDLAARLTDADVDLVRPGDDTGPFVAGYRNPAGPADERFAAWRASAARHGRILVITGSGDLLPSEATSLDQLLDVIRDSWAALVPLTPGSAPPGIPLSPQATDADLDGDDLAEYSELLTTKLRSQESFEASIASIITAVIGRHDLQRWITRLWPVACQTCGEPLGSKADINADQLAGGTVRLSMHHSACRPSGTAPPGETMHRPTSSFAAGSLTRPGAEPRSGLPVLVINPSCEQLLLQPDDSGGWRNATLDEFTALGLAPATGRMPPTARHIRAELHDDRLRVTVAAGHPTGHEWTLTPPLHVREQLRRYRGFAISVTTKALPAVLFPDDLPAAFADPEALTGWVHLNQAAPSGRRRSIFRRRGEPIPPPPEQAEEGTG